MMRTVLYAIPKKARFTERCFQKIKDTSPYQSSEIIDRSLPFLFFSVHISIAGTSLNRRRIHFRKFDMLPHKLFPV